MSEAVPVLEMMAISKRFPGVQALSAVDFRLFSGEVHSVMGQNGAGKSTLIKVLTGVHPADSGRILLEGNEIRPSSPLDAQKLGISTVYQEVNLCPNLSVARRLKAQGMAILFITHFIDQTFEISDRITVLRNGSLVGEYPVSALSRMELITRMVGREIEEGGPARARDAGLPAAVAGGGRSAGNGARTATPFLSASGLGRRGSVRDVDLQVTCGESLGIGGLLGSGRTEIARLLFGIDQLSGGNQQKALLARWMATDPRMLILDEPTRGIDVAAKVEIMRQVMELCDKGMAVVFISAEMDEVVRYSNRVAVMRDRRKVGEIESREADEHTVFQIIAGGQT